VESAGRPVIAQWRDLTPTNSTVVVVLGFGAILLTRIELAPTSLWRDDAWVALVHRAPLTDVVRMGVTAPGFAFLIREWLAIVGFSELRAQLPEFVAFAVTPPLVYLLAVRMGVRRTIGLLAAVLVLTSGPLMEVAGRVKSYSFDALGGVAAMWAAWGVVERPQSGKRWATLAAASMLLTILTSAVADVVAAAFAVAILSAAQAGVLFRRHVLIAVGGYTAFAALYWATVLSPTMTPSLRISFGGAMIPGAPGQSRWAGIHVRLADLVSHFTPLAAHHASQALGLLVVAVAVGTARRFQLTLLLALPVVIAVVLALRRIAPLGGGGPITVNGSRIDVHLYPSLALLFAVGVGDLIDGLSELRLIHRHAAPALALVASAALVLTAKAPGYPQEDTKGLIRAAEAAAGPADSVVIQTDTRYQFGLYSRAPVQIIFSRRFENGFTVATKEPHILIMGSGPTEDGNSDSAVFGLVPVPPPPKPPSTPRVWVVSSTFYSAPTGVDAWLRSVGYQDVMQRTAPGAVLQEWAKPA